MKRHRSVAGQWLDEHEPYLFEVSERLWEMPETAHAETRSAAYLVNEIEQAGFDVDVGVADLPTAFVASCGAGRPCIGIVALLDALPGLSQERLATERRPVTVGRPGHGCGHNLIGAADLGSALAVQRVMNEGTLDGTLRLIGAPAEEIYHGGVYMVRDGVFDELDALLFWHPSSVTSVMNRSGLAMDSLRLVFHGLASDATDSRRLGIDALREARALASACDAERWPENVVVNHTILEGGTIPSIVTERATLWFFVHAPTRDDIDATRRRLLELAAGATQLEIQHLSATSEWLINHELAALLQRELEATALPSYSSDELQLAEALRSDFAPSGKAFRAQTLSRATGSEPVLVSDDTAEASWVTPRGGFLATCFPSGVPSHTWQWTSAAASSFAHKGMMRAARVVANSAVELMTNPSLLRAVREEFERATRGRTYRSPLPEGIGAFDYL